MNIEELENKIKELSKELEKLKEEKEEKKENKRWRAKENEEYFCITANGTIIRTNDYRYSDDNFKYLTGNYFKTEEEAEKKLEKIIIYMQLKNLALKLNEGEKIDWNNKNQMKHFIYYDFIEGTFRTDYTNYCVEYSKIYCLNKDFKAKALEEIGEGNLKLLFGVDE